MRFIARVVALSAAALMTVGVASASAEQPNRFAFQADPGAAPVSGKTGDWTLVTILPCSPGETSSGSTARPPTASTTFGSNWARAPAVS